MARKPLLDWSELDPKLAEDRPNMSVVGRRRRYIGQHIGYALIPFAMSAVLSAVLVPRADDLAAAKLASTGHAPKACVDTHPKLDLNTSEGWLALINQERVAHGLSKLTSSLMLQDEAHRTANDMVGRNSFENSDIDDAANDVKNKVGPAWESVGVNVGYYQDGQPGDCGAEQVAAAMWQDPTTQSRWLDPTYESFGVGVSDAPYGAGSLNGRRLLVLDFLDTVDLSRQHTEIA